MLVSIDHISIKHLILLSILSCLVSLSRLPNIVILPITTTLIVIYARLTNKNPRKYLRYAIFYFMATTIFIMIALTLMYGSISTYLSIYQQEQIGAHSISTLLSSYLYGIYTRTQAIALVGSGFIIIYLLNKYNAPKWMTYALLIAETIFYYVYLHLTELSGTNNTTGALYLAWLFLCISYTALKSHYLFPFLSIASFTLITSIGSNTAFMRAMAIQLIPIALAFAIPLIGKATKQFSIALLISTILFIPLAKKRLFRAECNPTPEYQSTSPILKGIYMGQSKASYIDSVYHDATRLQRQGKRFIVVGDPPKYIFDYILMLPQPTGRHIEWEFNVMNNPQYVNTRTAQIRQIGKSVAVLVIKEGYKKASLMERRLSEIGLTAIIDNPDYAIYTFDK